MIAFCAIDWTFEVLDMHMYWIGNISFLNKNKKSLLVVYRNISNIFVIIANCTIERRYITKRWRLRELRIRSLLKGDCSPEMNREGLLF